MILDDKTPAQKLRADVAKQVAKYAKCLAGVAKSCEKTGVNVGLECNLATGTATLPADPNGVLAVQVAKCDAKLDFDKKGPTGNPSVQNYELLGCPRFGGGPRLADMNALEDDAAFLKTRMGTYVGTVASVSGCTDNQSCATDAKILLDLYFGILKCETACENDYSNRKGNGGPTDSTSQCTGADPAVQACMNRVVAKYIVKAADWPVRDFAALTVVTDLNAITNDLFNAPAGCN